MYKRPKLDEQMNPEPVSGPAALKTLVIGAGGLGCEILKNLALSGFKSIDVVDMDMIELTNLNRQFLFRKDDIGKPKAEVAARIVNKRVSGTAIKAHVAAIQDLSDDFYRQFHLVICGLDSVVARRWINAKLFALSQELGPMALKPMIDGGCEGLMGQSRLIIPGVSACYECNLGMVASSEHQSYPLCTIASHPRLPEHCIEWARILAWPKAHPDGKEPEPDVVGDMEWIYQQALKRGIEYGVEGVTLPMTYGVVKRIIPAVASTNAIIAAECCLEAFKLASSCAPPLDNYCQYSGKRGVYTHTFSLEKREDCLICGSQVGTLRIKNADEATVGDVVEQLKKELSLAHPSLSSASTSLYMCAPVELEIETRENLKKPIKRFLQSGDEIAVTDKDLPFPARVTCLYV